MSDPAPGPEFSRPIKLTEIGRLKGFEIEATAEERARLARRFGLDGIDSLTATVDVRKAGPGLYRVSGSLEAAVRPVCVVTLEPFASTVSEDYEALYAESRAAADLELAEVDLDPDAEDPEPLTGNAIDVGELVAQHLALALDPYPHKPGIEGPVEITIDPDAEDAHSANPFAALERIKRGR
ncbi:MAG: DUF177 domain-containing protein [Azospirillaceae bacterium]